MKARMLRERGATMLFAVCGRAAIKGLRVFEAI
jgi:hypothetical protein